MGTVCRTEIKAGTIKGAALHMVIIYVLRKKKLFSSAVPVIVFLKGEILP